MQGLSARRELIKLSVVACAELALVRWTSLLVQRVQELLVMTAENWLLARVVGRPHVHARLRHAAKWVLTSRYEVLWRGEARRDRCLLNRAVVRCAVSVLLLVLLLLTVEWLDVVLGAGRLLHRDIVSRFKL